jgi:hypothetical protein
LPWRSKKKTGTDNKHEHIVFDREWTQMDVNIIFTFSEFALIRGSFLTKYNQPRMDTNEHELIKTILLRDIPFSFVLIRVNSWLGFWPQLNPFG